MNTHIETLNVETAKGRRRIRRTLGLPAGAPLSLAQAAHARIIARNNETASVRKTKTKTKS